MNIFNPSKVAHPWRETFKVTAMAFVIMAVFYWIITGPLLLAILRYLHEPALTAPREA